MVEHVFPPNTDLKGCRNIATSYMRTDGGPSVSGSVITGDGTGGGKAFRALSHPPETYGFLSWQQDIFVRSKENRKGIKPSFFL